MPDSFIDGDLRLPGRVREPPRWLASGRAQVLFATAGTSELRVDVHRRRHHTLLPRTLCIAALLTGLGSPIAVLMLNRAGHLDLNANGIWIYDETAERVLTVGVAGAATALVVGWLWWATAAAANARHSSRWGMSPWTPLASVAVSAVAVAFLPQLVEGQEEGVQSAIGILVALVVMVAHLGVVAGFRRAADAIGAPQGGWTLLIVLPWAAAALGAVAGFYAAAANKPMMMAVPVIALAIYGWYALTMYQAMLSFDRACIGTRILVHDDDSFTRFLQHR